MTHAYRGEFELAAPAETVFAHLVEPHLLTAWWPDGAATDPTPGGEYHLWWDGPDIMQMGKTHLVVEHEAESEEERGSYQQGWEFFLPQLGDAAAAASDHS